MNRILFRKMGRELRCARQRIAWALLGVLAFGLIYFGLGDQLAGRLFFHVGYFATLGALLGLAVSLFVIIRRSSGAFKISDFKTLIRVGLAVAVAGGWLLLVHSEWGYKDPSIDPPVVSSSKNLHLDRQLFILDSGMPHLSGLLNISGHADKRPWLTAFATSLVHDLTGYRVANAFFLNAAFGVLLLLLGYLQGHLFFGHRGGAMVVLLWCSLPLLTHNATGAGIDLLNVLMIQAVMLLSVLYLRKPDGMREAALCFAAVLLAHARYESALFILPVIAVILAGWVRAGRIILSPGAICAAPLLIPLGALHRYLADRPDLWELPLEYGSRFGLEFLTENLPHALYFFFNLSDHLPNSLVLPILGLPCLLFMILIMRREGRAFWKKSEHFVFTVFAGFLLVHFLLILAYYDGHLDQMVSARFALPFCLLLVLVVPFVLGQVRRNQWVLRFIWVLIFVHLLYVTMPVRAKAFYREHHSGACEQEWLEAYAQDHLEWNALMIDRYPLLWLLEDYASFSPEWSHANAENILRSIQAGEFANAYYIERFFWNGREATGGLATEAVNPYRMTVLTERSFRPFEKTRISKVEGLRLPASVELPAEPSQSGPISDSKSETPPGHDAM